LVAQSHWIKTQNFREIFPSPDVGEDFCAGKRKFMYKFKVEILCGKFDKL
jgi:hypothetical protein